MNDFNTDKQYLLDLLVDGELAEPERRELLAWCQREPDGWRRCALAFLEAQDWSKVLGELTDDKTAALVGRASSPSPLVARRQTFWSIRQGGAMLAMAASVGLAFMLGVWTRDAGKAGRFAPGNPAAIGQAAMGGAAALNTVSDGEKQQPVGGRTGQPEQGPETARLFVGGPFATADEIQLPLIEAGDLAGGWLPEQPAAVPEEVRRALERLGHHVEQQRRLAPFRLDDGRRVFVPVDQVQVRPVEKRAYQ